MANLRLFGFAEPVGVIYVMVVLCCILVLYLT